MTNEDLVQQYQEGDKQALEALIKQNRGIVRKLASKFYTKDSNSIDKEDLEQEGTIGLIIAAGKYNANMENSAKFITYAVHWIYQKMNRFITYRNTNNETSIHNPLSSSEDLTIEDSLGDKHNYYEAVEEKIYSQQLREEIETVMNNTLSLKEREIIKLRNGWDTENPMTLNEIGEVLEVTGNRARQIEAGAYRKIRKTSWGVKKIKEYAEEDLRRRKIHRYDSFNSLESYEVKKKKLENIMSRLRNGEAEESVRADFIKVLESMK